MDQNHTVEYRHLHLGIEGTPSVTIRAEYALDSTFISYAICHPEDQFCRATGRDIAKKTRNLRYMELFNWDGYKETPVEVRLYEHLSTFPILSNSELLLKGVIRDHYIHENDLEAMETGHQTKKGLLWKLQEKVLSIPMVQDYVLGRSGVSRIRN